MVAMFIPGSVPLFINIPASSGAGYGAWHYEVKASPEERLARARELAQKDFETQERRLFVPQVPYSEYLRYHMELQQLASPEIRL